MGLALTIMLILLASAWGLGALARGRGARFLKFAGAAGVAALFVLPLVYEATQFEGICYDVHGATQPCTLSERLWHSFELGFAFTAIPAIMWIAVYALSARIEK